MNNDQFYGLGVGLKPAQCGHGYSQHPDSYELSVAFKFILRGGFCSLGHQKDMSVETRFRWWKANNDLFLSNII